MSFRITDVDLGYAAVVRRVKDLAGKGTQLEVGLPENVAGLPSGDGRHTLLDIGLWMEFGNAVTPARPWLRAWFDESQNRAMALLNLLIGQVIRGEMTKGQAVADFGDWCVDGIKKRISAGIRPDNAPATIAKKGSDTPLIDTRTFYDAITYMVKRASS